MATITATQTETATIPADVMAKIERATRRILTARQKVREARHYATIESGTGNGLVCRETFRDRLAVAGVDAAQVRQDRALIRKIAGIGEELGIDMKAVLKAVWADEAAALPKLRFELWGVKGVRWCD